ncbi:MAG: DUF916 and DUF3324 domain-containing protein [Oscillospiraceae bacterium]|nr:DUF916 and DUF3324 domain-containing protein [Oscillospiraceae bacterium]
MRKAIKTTAIVTVFLTTMIALAFTARAGLGGFSATPNVPENQDPAGSAATFDIFVTPGMQQEISIDVTNQRSEPIAVEISLFTAGTNMNGIISYSAGSPSDDSIPFRLEDVATLPPEAANLTVPAQSTIAVPITINIPDISFDGMTLGAVNVLLGATDEERAQAGMVVNRFASTIPLRMRMEGGARAEDADFYLGEVSAELVSQRAAIVARIHHTAPRMTMGAIASIWIYPHRSDTPAFYQIGRPIDFAPNAVFPATILNLGGSGIQPGQYLARVQVEYDGRVWDFEQAFTVAPQIAHDINLGAFNQQQAPMPIAAPGLPTHMIVLIAVGVLLLILLIILIIKTKKRNKSEQLMWDMIHSGNAGMPPATSVPTMSGSANVAHDQKLDNTDKN